MSKKKSIKKRNWAFILYPESAPKNWVEQLTKTGLQCAVSPLHDKDINADGTPKKPHYHIILTYSGPTSYNVVKRLTEQFNAPIPQALEQIKGYYRYLTHKDNPEKYQYDANEIKSINGFSIRDSVGFTRSEVNAIKQELQKLIKDKDLVEYAELMDYVLDDPDLYDVACNNTIFFDRYLTSRRHMPKDVDSKRTIKVDVDTGEILE
ncbi:MAG: plasmid replication protein [Euryarchaeota archaeon]|nr:plasmid replication protein [Euryarchaeota archaeon]